MPRNLARDPDHFEELGRPASLVHGGFGLLTIGNLRKPRFWALKLLERLGPEELAVELDGDGAGGLVEAWASRDPDGGRVAVALWNVTLDQTRSTGEPLLDRRVTLRVEGLAAAAYEVRHLRVDLELSNITCVWEAMSRRGRLARRRPVGGPTRGQPAGGAGAGPPGGGRRRGRRARLRPALPSVSLVELVPA
jgi:xylan 1,4-beta-xylosidase